METHPPLPSDIWDHTPLAAQASIAALVARIATLEAPVKHCTERLPHDSSNSSRPPSSDGAAKKTRERRRRQPSGRGAGGQPGHRGQTCAVLPVDEVDEVIALPPSSGATCHHDVGGEDPQPPRHQVRAMPPMRPVVPAYQVQRLGGELCGATTRGAWPHGVSTELLGPRAQAIVSLCTGAYRLSQRTPQGVWADLFGWCVRVGTISNREASTPPALVAPVEEARAYIQEHTSAHLDETGWRQGGKRAWLWVASTTWVTVFLVRVSRGAHVAKELLGARFAGILVTDRWRAYTWYPVRWRQRCWAHRLWGHCPVPCHPSASANSYA